MCQATWNVRRRTGRRLSCRNFNVHNDVCAARLLFHSVPPFVLFDTVTYLRQSMEEAEQTVAPHGPLGKFLVDIRRREPRWAAADKGPLDLGDIALLVHPEWCERQEVPAPSVDWELASDHAHSHGHMQRVYHVDRKGTFALLSRTLEECARR